MVTAFFLYKQCIFWLQVPALSWAKTLLRVALLNRENMKIFTGSRSDCIAWPHMLKCLLISLFNAPKPYSVCLCPRNRKQWMNKLFKKVWSVQCLPEAVFQSFLLCKPRGGETWFDAHINHDTQYLHTCFLVNSISRRVRAASFALNTSANGVIVQFFTAKQQHPRAHNKTQTIALSRQGANDTHGCLYMQRQRKSTYEHSPIMLSSQVSMFCALLVSTLPKSCGGVCANTYRQHYITSIPEFCFA